MKKFIVLSIVAITLFASCKEGTAKKEESSSTKIEKGAISPNFELDDINGYMVSLNSLKGKVVYIDIWATWCIPCINEVPSLQKMEEHFKGKDIAFVSICIKDREKLWKKMVKEKGFTGIQVFDEKGDSSFIEQYGVASIPRFILIDKEGKIIDANALPPSDPKLQEQIAKYL